MKCKIGDASAAKGFAEGAMHGQDANHETGIDRACSRLVKQAPLTARYAVSVTPPLIESELVVLWVTDFHQLNKSYSQSEQTQ